MVRLKIVKLTFYSISMKQRYPALILILFFALQSRAQRKELGNAQLAEKISFYGQRNPVQPLFVHIDKNIYTNNEKLWFSTYLLNPSDPSEQEDILTLAIINTLQKKVYVSAKFKIQNGVCVGALQIPDSVPPGQYQVHAHTNRMEKFGKPVASYNQLIQVKSIRYQTLKSKLEFMNGLSQVDTIHVKLSIDNLDPGSKKKPEVSYTLGAGLKKALRPDKTNGYMIHIPVTDIPPEAPILSTCIKHDKDVVYNSLMLPPSSPKKLKVRFVPEGGVATYSLRTIIGLESLDYYGQPVSISGILKEDDRIIDTVSTNSYGMGRFPVFLEKAKRYTITLLDKDMKKSADVFQLPLAVEDGIALSLPVAVVKDTLHLNIASRQEKLVKVLIHDYQDTYAAVNLPLKVSNNRLAVAIPTLSRGFYTVSVLTPEGVKIAERLFFANKGSSAKALLSTNKKQYRKRETINLKIKVKSSGDTATAQGVISIACIQQNRLSSYDAQNIESYYYLKSATSELPDSPGARDLEDSVYLEDIALLRTSGDHIWESVIADALQKAPVNVILPALTVHVQKGGKPLKQVVELSVFDLNGVNLFTTDSQGNKDLKAQDLLTPAGTKQKLSVNVKNKDDYSILTVDPDTAIMNWVLNHDVRYVIRQPIANNTEQQLSMQGLENVTRLKEVEIKALRNNAIYSTKPVGSNECGDYVNRDGYLNWPGSANDLGNRSPVKGVRYIDGKRYTRPNGELDDYRNLRTNGDTTFSVAFIIYEGCSTDANKQYTEVEGIRLPEEFRPLNQEQLSSSEPQYLSTIFWQAGIVLDGKGEYNVSFPASDISGPFSIVVQGVHSDDVIYEEKLVTIN
jgi:hypothetical protein